VSSTPWWRHAAVYQIYVRSFADSNGDGTGDVNGIRSRLGYLRDLGVDAVWINPWYRSPLADGGYDVADYRDIEPRFGTLADAEALIAEASAEGIRVIADLVPNHTSDQHPWFQEALAAPPGHASRARYHFLPGTSRGGSQPPNDWRSAFGGPAWTQVDDGEWYLHLFNAGQPDLNWEHPEVRAEFEDILRFWLDRGIAGFRVDVAHALVKDMSYPDIGARRSTRHAGGHPWFDDHPHWDRDGLHEIARGWRRVLDEYVARGIETMMVAEAWVASQERLARFLRSDEYHQSFNFDFLVTPWDAAAMRVVVGESLAAAASVGSTPTWVLSNHDVVRHATRYGLPAGTDAAAWLLDGPHDALDDGRGLRRARAAALLMLALPGSAYLYQGDELGLPEVWDLPIDALDDPVWRQSKHTRKGRDGCRVPIPWTSEGPSFGFGDGPAWLPQPRSFAAVAVSAQTGVEGSTLELYRATLAARRRWMTGDESLTWLESPDAVLAFERGSGAQCWVNMSDGPVDLPAGRSVVVASEPVVAGALAADAAAWLAPISRR
jgi:alpha-glucosidase